MTIWYALVIANILMCLGLLYKITRLESALASIIIHDMIEHPHQWDKESLDEAEELGVIPDDKIKGRKY